MKRLLIPLLFLGALTLMPNSAQAGGSRYGFSVGFGGHSGFASFSYGRGGYGGHGHYGHGGYYGRGYGHGHYGHGYYRNRYAASFYFAPVYDYPVYYAAPPVVYVEPAPYYAYPRYYRSSRMAPRYYYSERSYYYRR